MRSTVSHLSVLLLLTIMLVASSTFQLIKADVSSSTGLMRAADTDWWPMFHHDLMHSGYSTSAAPATNQTLWTYATGGSVDSSPAVVNGVVYVGSEDGNVYALNATTGAFVWKYKTGNGVDSSPAVINGIVYVGSEDDNLYAINAATGALAWKYATAGKVESSPAVSGDLVYVGSDDDNVYALNASTGNLVWNYTTYGPVYSSPAVANGVVYASATELGIHGHAGVTYALNASTGTLEWNYTAPPLEQRIKGWSTNSPVVVSSVVFVIIYYYGPVGVCGIVALNASTGALLSNFGGGGDLGGSDLAVAGDVAFIGTTFEIPLGGGYTLAWNTSSGAQLWSYPIETYGGINSSGISTFCSPSIASGIVLVGGDKEVFALNASRGALTWSRTTGGVVESSPAVADGVVYVGSDDGNVYAFGFDPIHTVAVTSVVPLKTVVGQGFGTKIDVTVANQGGFPETFNVTVYANTTSIGSYSETLAIGTSRTTSLVCSTTGLVYGNYTISADVTLVLGETNTWIGPFTYGTVKVTIPGDIGGYGVVGPQDFHILAQYWLETVPPAPANVDIGGYGVVGPQDFHILAQHWLV